MEGKDTGLEKEYNDRGVQEVSHSLYWLACGDVARGFRTVGELGIRVRGDTGLRAGGASSCVCSLLLHPDVAILLLLLRSRPKTWDVSPTFFLCTFRFEQEADQGPWMDQG